MRNILRISFLVIFTFAACCVYAQRPVKPSKQLNEVPQTIGRPLNVSFNQPNQTAQCWEITGQNGDLEFRWDIEANVSQWVNEMQAQHNEAYTYKACNHQSVESCDANNEKVQPKKCWKITATKNGQGYEQYLWSTETVARRKASNLQSEGYQQAKYEETPANDEKSCHAPATNTNPNEPTCWKIVIGNAVTYLWGYEVDAQATVNAAINSGQTASYELSPNKTKDSCR